MACAVARRWRSFSIKLRSKTLTIALNTVSIARRAVLPLRATSVGNATIDLAVTRQVDGSHALDVEERQGHLEVKLA